MELVRHTPIKLVDIQRVESLKEAVSLAPEGCDSIVPFPTFGSGRLS